MSNRNKTAKVIFENLTSHGKPDWFLTEDNTWYRICDIKNVRICDNRRDPLKLPAVSWEECHEYATVVAGGYTIAQQLLLSEAKKLCEMIVDYCIAI